MNREDLTYWRTAERTLWVLDGIVNGAMVDRIFQIAGEPNPSYNGSSWGRDAYFCIEAALSADEREDYAAATAAHQTAAALIAEWIVDHFGEECAPRGMEYVEDAPGLGYYWHETV